MHDEEKGSFQTKIWYCQAPGPVEGQSQKFLFKGKDLGWHYNQTGHQHLTPPPLNFTKVET